MKPSRLAMTIFRLSRRAINQLKRWREKFGNGRELIQTKLCGCETRTIYTKRTTSTSTKASANSRIPPWTGSISIRKEKSSSPLFFTSLIASPSTSTTTTTPAKTSSDSILVESSSLKEIPNSFRNTCLTLWEWLTRTTSTSTSPGKPSKIARLSRSLTRDSLRRYWTWFRRSPTTRKSPMMRSKENSKKTRRSWLWWRKKSYRRRRMLLRKSFCRIGSRDTKTSTRNTERRLSSASWKTRPTGTNWPPCLDGTQLETPADSSLSTTISRRWRAFKIRSTSSVAKTELSSKNHP